MDNEFDQFEGARSKQRAKRRQKNVILNSLIFLVLALIVFVSYTIFSGGDQERADREQATQTETTSPKSGNEQTGNTGNQSQATSGVQNQPGDEQGMNQVDEDVVVEEGTNQNVKQTIINPAWKPIGTEQTGEHVTVFQKGSVDWTEMEEAMAYATGITRDNMTVWYISNGGPNKAIGTITANDSEQAYRVYIEWVNGQGWKPTMIEELIKNDKGKSEVE